MSGRSCTSGTTDATRTAGRSSAVLRAADNPALAAQIGDEIVTASGLTLLGADDKAGVAEIMAAVEELSHSRDACTVRCASRSRRTKRSAMARTTSTSRASARVCAYTLDGGEPRRAEFESFSADAITVTFKGFNTHPGYAKGRMVNAIRVAADFVAALPRGEMSPETTDGLRRIPPSLSDAGVGGPHERQGARP